MKARLKSIRFWLITWFIFNSSFWAFALLGKFRPSRLARAFVDIYLFCEPIRTLYSRIRTPDMRIILFMTGLALIMILVATLPVLFWAARPSYLRAYFLAVVGISAGPCIILFVQTLATHPERLFLIPIILAGEFLLFWLFNRARKKCFPGWKIPIIDDQL